MTEKTAISTNGKKGGNLVGKPHRNKSGEDVGGIKAVVTDANNQPVELEGGEVIINKAASKKYWKELSRINQSAGNGVPINKPVDPIDEDPTEYEKGGKIEFNANKIPNKWILAYAEKIKSEHPEIWKLGGNIFGNEAFENLKRVAKRGYWLDEERWMFIKWQSFVARHKQDFRIAGVVAMLKWVDKVDKGWAYMKELIEAEIQKKSKKKGFTKKLSTGGNLKNDCIDFIMKSEPITKNGYYLHIKNLNAYIDSGDKTISNIKSLVLITYNSGGQSNLKASNTINASELSSEIAKLLDCKITVARIIVSEQIKSAKRFSLNILKSIQHENIVVADRDKIVCTNINAQYKQGGKVDSYKDKYNRKYNYEENTSHSLEDIAKDSGVSIKGIQQIYNKGIGAYKTNPQSVRPNVKSKEQWAMARVYSSVMGGKASIVDKNELKLSKGGNIMSITKVILTDFDEKKYFGQYRKVFNAFNKDSLGFTEGAYELDSSGERDSNGNYILLISQYPDSIVQDRLDKIIGISYEIIDIENNKNYFEKGGVTKKSDILNSAYYSKGGKTNTCESFDENGERKIDKKSIEHLTECILKLPQTKELNTDSNGNYTKERKDLHLKIFNDFKKDLVCIDNDNPIAILMGGSPASGKSTFLRKYRPFLLNSELLKIDADEIRAKLPEYKGFNATQTHQETKDMVNTLISDKTIGIPCDFDIIYDGTMNSIKSYVPLIKLLKSRNYKIFIVYIDNVEYDIVLNRMLSRYKKSGRFVPVEVIDDFFSKGKEALNSLKKDVDGYLIVDGSTNDYNILEQGGIKLPKSRVYSKLGRPLKEINKLSKGGETPTQQAKISKVMSEFKNGTLKTSYGETVTDDKQAIAIAVSEAGIKKYATGGKLADNFIVLESVGSIMDTNGFGTFYPMFKNGQPDLDNGTKYSELKGTDFINNLSSEDNNIISFYADKFIERYQFFTYVSDYYGKYGIYKDDYEGGFTEDQIEEAVLNYIADPKTNWGGGDTVDRELTRDKYLVPLLNKSSTNRDEYFVGDTGFYNGKTRVPIEITKISGKNVYFKDGDGNIKRSEKRNFERLYEASNTNSNRPVVSKPIAPKPIKNKKISVTNDPYRPQVNYLTPILSTDESTWNADFKIGDKVKIRWDFCNESDTNTKGFAKINYFSNENNFTIKSFDIVKDFKRLENPSGKLYVLSSGQSWEGKDLELAGSLAAIISPNIPAKNVLNSDRKSVV